MAGKKSGIEAGRAYVKAYLDDSLLTRGLKGLRTKFASFADSLASVGTRLIGVGAGIGGLFAAPLRRAAMLEMLTADLAVLLGSTEKAKKLLADFRRFAAQTPLEFADVAELGRQVLNWKLATENNVVEVLRQIGDASGGIPERMASVIRALGQMRATGRLQADEMNQLTEAGLPAWELLAKVLGTDVAGAMEAVTARQVDAARAVPALIRALGAFGDGRMARMAQTLLGRWSALKDAFWEAVTPLGEALLPLAGKLLTLMSDAVSRGGAWIKTNAALAPKIAVTAAAAAAGADPTAGVGGADGVIRGTAAAKVQTAINTAAEVGTSPGMEAVLRATQGGRPGVTPDGKLVADAIDRLNAAEARRHRE
ncbi:MAG TPA: tape measure protein, partial [Planctomycetaceae bacterium]